MDFCGIKRWIKKPFLPLDVIWAVENEMEEDILWDMESVGMEYDSQKSFK